MRSFLCLRVQGKILHLFRFAFHFLSLLVNAEKNENVHWIKRIALGACFHYVLIEVDAKSTGEEFPSPQCNPRLCCLRHVITPNLTIQSD